MLTWRIAGSSGLADGFPSAAYLLIGWENLAGRAASAAVPADDLRTR